MSHLSCKMACSDCVALLPCELAEVHTKGGPGPCEFCGGHGVGGPLTWSQLNHILDARGLWRPKPGGEAVLVQPPSRKGLRTVAADRIGKYVHILEQTTEAIRAVEGHLNEEPWFTVRIVGAAPPPGDCYPAYPQSALAEYKLSRESLLDREATLKENIRSMPTAEKLRLAADFIDRGLPDIQAANIIKRALLEVDGTLPKVPMPEVPPC
jgi:hypothetical protein